MRPGWWIIPGAVLGLSIWTGSLWLTFGPRAEYDAGGSITAYAARALVYDGPLPLGCASACTLYLLRGCVTQAHQLAFHLPSVDHPYWRGLMARHYPPAIASWFWALPKGNDVWHMTGAQAINYGARQCP